MAGAVLRITLSAEMIRSVPHAPWRNDVVCPSICDELAEVLMHVGHRGGDVRVYRHAVSEETRLGYVSTKCSISMTSSAGIRLTVDARIIMSTRSPMPVLCARRRSRMGIASEKSIRPIP